MNTIAIFNLTKRGDKKMQYKYVFAAVNTEPPGVVVSALCSDIIKLFSPLGEENRFQALPAFREIPE